jgi:DNA-directed RNA polymerase subunit H (RpoH/RPB5)
MHTLTYACATSSEIGIHAGYDKPDISLFDLKANRELVLVLNQMKLYRSQLLVMRIWDSAIRTVFMPSLGDTIRIIRNSNNEADQILSDVQ